MKHIDEIDWHNLESVEDAANELYNAIVMDYLEAGEDPSGEVQIYSPEESQVRGYTSGWQVVWECGPMNWGMSMSLQILSGGIIPPWGFCETQWGFDLTFVEE